MSLPREGRGPFRVSDVKPGSRYELDDGHAIYCAPTGGDGARSTVAGAEVLDTDPAVDQAGIDAGYQLGDISLRASDVSVGNVPDAPEFIRGAPPLAVEYAGSGQDEDELQAKIRNLIAAGTRWVWVVRLIGERRVEVYVGQEPPVVLREGEELAAPGVLRNTVPVEALFRRDKAHEVTLRNLLQRKGYESLDEVRDRGREEGRAAAVLAVLAARGIPLTGAERERISSCRDGRILDEWLRRVATVRSAVELLST